MLAFPNKTLVHGRCPTGSRSTDEKTSKYWRNGIHPTALALSTEANGPPNVADPRFVSSSEAQCLYPRGIVQR